jgi:hypothetical protein
LIKRRFLKITSIILLLIAVLLLCFHFWFINRSVKLLEEFVATQSGGKYRLSIKKLNYNYARLLFELEQPSLICVDTTSVSDKYDVRAKRITLNLKQLLPLVLRKQIRLDSFLVDAPQINIIHQKIKDTTKGPVRDPNISQDMFEAYASLRNSLGLLQVDQFRIANASFSIQNVRKQQSPLQVSGIDFLVKGLNINPENTPEYDPLAITDSIKLSIAGQTINFPDGNKSISFKSFQFNTFDGALTLDSCRVISSNDSTASNFNIYTDKLSFKKLRLVSRNGEDFTQIDSVFFIKPAARLLLEAKTSKKDSTNAISNTLRKVVETITGNAAVNYIGINNMAFDITTLKSGRENNFKFVQDKLEIGEVMLSKDSIVPIGIGTLRFGLKRYTNYFNDSTYFIQFDSVRILDGQLALYDFQLQSTPKAPQLQRVNIPVLLLNGVDWYRLIFERRFVAKNISLYDPQITLTAAAKKGGKGNVLDVLQESFAVEHVLLQNAGVRINFSKNEYAQVRRLNLNMAPSKLLQAPSLTMLIKMLSGMDATDIAFVKGGWNAKINGIRISDTGGVRLPVFNIENKSKNIKLQGQGLQISKLSVDEKKNTIALGKLSWKNITGSIILPEKKNTSGNKSDLNITIAGITGGPTDISVKAGKTEASVLLSSVNTSVVNLTDGKLTQLQNLALRGKEWKVQTAVLKANGSIFNIAQQKPSSFSAIHATTNESGKDIKAVIPEITFQADVEKMLQQQYLFSTLTIRNPQLTASIINALPAKKTGSKPYPDIQVQRLEIVNPKLEFLQVKNNDTTQLTISEASLTTGIFSTASTISLRQMQMQAGKLNFQKGDSMMAGLADGKLALSVADFSLYQNNTAGGNWKLTNASLGMANAFLKTKNRKGKADTLAIASFKTANFSATENATQHWRSLVFGQPALQFQNVTLQYHSTDNIFMVEDLNTIIGSNKIILNSFLFHPQLDEEAYIKAHHYETDFIRTKTGRMEIYDFNRQAFIKDSSIRIRHISIDDVDFKDTRDKTPPFKEGIIKPLPGSMIRKIPFDVAIDSLTLQNANVSYKEVSEKTGQPGTIFFTEVQSKFLNLKNRNYSIRDTFQWKTNARMMDSMPFFLGIKTAYLDTLDKLELTVRLRPADVTHLNTFFAPLEAIKFKTGSIDTIEMVSMANEYLAYGSMKFLYHNLKIEFLKKGETERKNILSSIITFAANTFVVKKKNTNRIGTVYAERLRERSIFNYIVKMTLSGMGSSIGSKKNKKLEKAYREKLKELNLQPL